MGIANSILDAVRTEQRRFPGAHIAKVGVRIGELAGVDPDAMAFCFEALVRGSGLEPLALEVEYTRRRYRCRECAHEFAAAAEDIACPACASLDAQFIGGDELELCFLEVEDGTLAAGA